MDCNQPLHSNEDNQVPFVGGPNMPQKKSKMADGRHLEKLKNCNNSTKIDEF